MAYDVLWTPDAKCDLEIAISYLAESVGMPSAAVKLLNEVEGLVQTLQSFPEAHEHVRDEFLASRGFCNALVGSYIVLNIVDQRHNEVVITNIVHSARDYARFV